MHNTDIKVVCRLLAGLIGDLVSVMRLWGSEGGVSHPHIFSKMQESWSEAGHGAKELVKIFSVTFSFQ